MKYTLVDWYDFDRPLTIAMSQAERKDYAAPFVAAISPFGSSAFPYERETRKFLAGALRVSQLPPPKDEGGAV